MKRRAFDLFQQGKSIEEVCQAVCLVGPDHQRIPRRFHRQPWHPGRGLDRRVAVQADPRRGELHGRDRLKPLFEALGGTVGYDQIRIAVACLRNGPPDKDQMKSPQELRTERLLLRRRRSGPRAICGA